MWIGRALCVYIYQPQALLSSSIRKSMIKMRGLLIVLWVAVAQGWQRPNPENAAAFARWLVAESSWGVLATLSPDNLPFGNVLSFTDSGTGVPVFYESKTRDRTGVYAVKDSRASFTVTEYVLGYCGNNDPQFPLCAKLTLSGELKILNKTTPEGKLAEDALIARHPQFGGFPKAVGFDVFQLQVKDIYLVNQMAPEKKPTVEDYFGV